MRMHQQPHRSRYFQIPKGRSLRISWTRTGPWSDPWRQSSRPVWGSSGVHSFRFLARLQVKQISPYHRLSLQNCQKISLTAFQAFFLVSSCEAIADALERLVEPTCFNHGALVLHKEFDTLYGRCNGFANRCRNTFTPRMFSIRALEVILLN